MTKQSSATVRNAKGNTEQKETDMTKEQALRMQVHGVDANKLTDEQYEELLAAVKHRTYMLNGMNVSDIRSIIRSDYDTNGIKLGQTKADLMEAVLHVDVIRWVREYQTENADREAQALGYESHAQQWATERRMTRLREYAAVDVVALAHSEIDKRGLKSFLSWGSCAEELVYKEIATQVLETTDLLIAGSDERKPVENPFDALQMAINSCVVHPMMNNYHRGQSTGQFSNALEAVYREVLSSIATRLY